MEKFAWRIATAATAASVFTFGSARLATRRALAGAAAPASDPATAPPNTLDRGSGTTAADSTASASFRSSSSTDSRNAAACVCRAFNESRRSTASSNDAVIASESRRSEGEDNGKFPDPLRPRFSFGDSRDIGEESSSGLVDPMALNSGPVGSGVGMSF